MEKVKCALCGQGLSETILIGKDYRYNLSNDRFYIVKCPDCNLLYLNPRPLKEKMGQFYPEAYYPQESFLQRILKPFFQRSLSKIKTIYSYKSKGKILEIGCGDGDLLFSLKKRGFQTYGVDVSRKACLLAEKKVGKNVFNCEVTDCDFPPKFFDVIVLNHSFEHVGSPTDSLKEIKRILKDKGILFISVPNIDCFQSKLWREKATILDIPRHLYLYSPKTLEMMLKKCGFQVVKISMPVFVFPPLDLFPVDTMQKLLYQKAILFILFPFLIPLTSLRIILCGLMGTPEIEVVAHIS